MSLFSCLIVVLCIEVLLQIGSFSYPLFQKLSNQEKSQISNEVIRILCIGESTTALGGADAYPSQLESILNEEINSHKIEVINRGVPAINSLRLLIQLPKHLRELKPDIVVTMLGINDEEYLATLKKTSASKILTMFHSLKLYELIDRLMDNFFKNSKEPPSFSINEIEQNDKLKKNDLQKEILQLKKAVQREPNNENHIIGLAVSYRDLGKLRLAEAMFEKAISMNPKNVVAYFEMGSFYRELGEYKKAEAALGRAKDIDPDRHWWPYVQLGAIYRDQLKYGQGEIVLKEGLKRHSDNYWMLFELALNYRDRGDLSRADELFKEILPVANQIGHDWPYLELGRSLRKQDKDEEADEMLRHALTLNPENDWVHYELSKDVKLKTKGEVINRYTRQNYREIAKLLRKANIPMVAVQYPTQSVEDLQRQLSSANRDIIYIDNEATFKHAVAKQGYYEIFTDRFAGNFGHATAKGNRLLAQNIAQQIVALLKKRSGVELTTG